MIYALIFDAAGNGVGVHSYAQAPSTYPTNELPCTETQAATPSLWTNAGGVITASLPAAQAAQIVVLLAACAAAITGGYTSSALGAAHSYGSQSTDQINMTASVVASLLPSLPSTWTTPFKCADSTGTWAMRPHTAAQIQQAGLDGKTWVTACQNQFDAFSAQVTAATSVEAVQAIVWSNP
jgi:hypothetical protein